MRFMRADDSHVSLTFKDLPAYCSCSLPESSQSHQWIIKLPFSWISYCNPTSLHPLSGLVWHSEVLFSFLQRLILLLMAFMHAYSQMLFYKPCFWAKSKGNQKKSFSFWDMTELNLLLDDHVKNIFFFWFWHWFLIYTDLKRSSSFIV